MTSFISNFRSTIRKISINIFNKISDIDLALKKSKLYVFISITLLLVAFILMFESFQITRTYDSSESSSYSSVYLQEGDSIDYFFVAQHGKLSNVRIIRQNVYSQLDQNDKMIVSVLDENKELVESKEVYIYNPNRPYISVPFDGLSLQRGASYYIHINIVELSSGSRLFLRTHRINIFESGSASAEDTGISDEDKGYRFAPDLSFDYSVLSPLMAVLYILLFISLVAILLFDRFVQNIKFIEIYRAIVGVFFVYLVMEVLNAAKQQPLRLFYPFEPKTFIVFLSSIFILLTIYFLFYAISARGWVALLMTLIIGSAIAYTSHAKMIMRGDPFMPWDIYAAGIAAKIASGYDFFVTTPFVVSFLIIPATLILIRLTHTKLPRANRVRIRCLLIFLSLGLISTFAFVVNKPMHQKYDITYALYPPLESFSENSTIYSFFLHLNNIKARGGEDSDPEFVDEIQKRYVEQVEALNLNDFTADHATPPNVIVVMSESFADYRLIRDIETTEPIMPFYDSILHDTIYGELQVSVFGGGTSSTEFEFLTGYSVGALLPGSSVYTFYLSDQVQAMPHLFRNQGYRTVAIHPFDPQWWDRDIAYPQIGFDIYYSQDDFIEPVLMRRFISDQSAFDRIIEEYESNISDAPFFCFTVTMQNHADYSMRYDNQNHDIRLESFPDFSFPYTENYLSLIRETDDALKNLIEYFEQVEEPTIIVFFGDHFATMDHGFYDALLDIDVMQMTIEESLSLYSVPYFIWTNYDSETGYAGLTSPNFLGQTLLDLSGIPSPDDRACLRVLQTKISALSALAVFDLEGSPWVDKSNLDDEIIDIINDYYRLQYASIYYSDE